MPTSFAECGRTCLQTTMSDSEYVVCVVILAAMLLLIVIDDTRPGHWLNHQVDKLLRATRLDTYFPAVHPDVPSVAAPAPPTLSPEDKNQTAPPPK